MDGILVCERFCLKLNFFLLCILLDRFCLVLGFLLCILEVVDLLDVFFSLLWFFDNCLVINWVVLWLYIVVGNLLGIGFGFYVFFLIFNKGGFICIFVVLILFLLNLLFLSDFLIFVLFVWFCLISMIFIWVLYVLLCFKVLL